ncbi:MAG TPA: hypothetical protein VFR04_09400 [Solirubrobacterales bacterium]|nr:hypothetical protein [Solirubrobacterales bacterium]
MAPSNPGAEADLVGQEVAAAFQEALAQAGDNRDDRQLLRVVLLEQLGNTRHSTRVLNLVEKILREDAQADKEDRKKLTDAEIRDRDERRGADLVDALLTRLNQEKREEAAEKREDRREKAAERRANECHEQEMKERETTREDSSRERNLFISLTVICVIATLVFSAVTIVFLFLTAKYSQPWGYVGSGIGLALTVATGATAPKGFRLLFSLAKTGGKGQEDESKPDD